MANKELLWSCGSQSLAGAQRDGPAEAEGAMTTTDTTIVGGVSFLAPLNPQWTPRLSMWMEIQNQIEFD